MRPSTTTMKSRVSVACMPGWSGSSPSTRIQSPPPSLVPGKRMMRTEQPPAGGSKPHRAIRFVAAVVDGGGGSVEPQPGRDREAVGPDRALRFAVGDDHRAPVGVVPGDHSPCREFSGCHGPDPTQPVVGAPEDPGAQEPTHDRASAEVGELVVPAPSVPLVEEQAEIDESVQRLVHGAALSAEHRRDLESEEARRGAGLGMCCSFRLRHRTHGSEKTDEIAERHLTSGLPVQWRATKGSIPPTGVVITARSEPGTRVLVRGSGRDLRNPTSEGRFRRDTSCSGSSSSQ